VARVVQTDGAAAISESARHPNMHLVGAQARSLHSMDAQHRLLVTRLR
jgi:hypothetical protein